MPTDCRDRLVVRTLRCGRSNPGSNPGHGSFLFVLFADARFCMKQGGVPPKKGWRTRAVSPQCEVRLKMVTTESA